MTTPDSLTRPVTTGEGRTDPHHQSVERVRAAREACSDLGHAVWDRGCQSCAFASNALTEAADAMEELLTLLSEAGRALEPFARRCEEAVRPDDSDNDGLTVCTADLRRARATLAAINPKQGGRSWPVR